MAGYSLERLTMDAGSSTCRCTYPTCTGPTTPVIRLPARQLCRSLAVRLTVFATDAGQRGGLATVESDRIKELERKVCELCQANEILCKENQELIR